MPVVGVKELKQHTSEIVKNLEEKKQSFILTFRGKPVAKITPVSEEELEDFFFSSANTPLMEILEEREKEPSISLDDLLKGK